MVLRDKKLRIVCGSCHNRVAQLVVVYHECDCEYCDVGSSVEDIDHSERYSSTFELLCYHCAGAGKNHGPGMRSPDHSDDIETVPYTAPIGDIFEELGYE